MDTRIGYPNEHLAGNSSEDISSPLFATAVGLVMNSIANNTQSAYKLEVSQAIPEQKTIVKPIPEQNQEVFQNEEEIVNKAEREPETTEGKIRKSFSRQCRIRIV
jgi:cell division protein FtsA